MKNRWFVACVVFGALGVAGCDSGEDGASGVQDRFANSPAFQFWNWFPEREANGDLEIHRGPTTQDEDCLLFDIAGAGITARSTDASSSQTFVPIATLEGNVIHPGDGSADCTANMGQLPIIFELRQDGQVLYTVVGNYVLAGAIDVPNVEGGWPALIDSQLLYEIDNDQVFNGYADSVNPYIMVTGSAELEEANPFRKLVIAALLDGACGSPGYQAYSWMG